MKQITGIMKTVDTAYFTNALSEDFSSEASGVLYDYYTNLSEVEGEPIEFDRGRFRGEWYEYEDDADFIRDMGINDLNEEIDEFQGWGTPYGYYAYRLNNGCLLVRA